MKFIFVTGGVVSSLGKGLTVASIGALLENQGFKINIQKMDPYLNIDPGTMNPCQHGEVYVLNDGTEVDLDFGHYERFTNVNLTYENSVTSGKIYESVLKKERRGEFLGETVQIIPHVTNEIKRKILSTNNNVDIQIIEIGGVTGDIEGLPFLEAIRQIALDIGKENVMFIHLTLIPYLKTAFELKTKPSQQSVAKLREIGIQPDVLICRTDISMPHDIRKKLALFCSVKLECVIEEKDVDTSIYELPLRLHEEKLDKVILEYLGLKYQNSSLDKWEKIVDDIKSAKSIINIGVVGKYIELKDAYKSIYESIWHAAIDNSCKVNIKTIDSEKLNDDNVGDFFVDLDGILVPGGFGSRGIEGMITAIRYAREHDIPFFGICLGMQLTVVEFARNVLLYKDANSTEIDATTSHPVICLMEQQQAINIKGNTMRLGANNCELIDGTLIKFLYKGVSEISERHRHRYEFNNKYLNDFEKNGMIISGLHKSLKIVESIELKCNKWHIGVQFHPEFKSKVYSPHPLFLGFVNACIDFNKKKFVISIEHLTLLNDL